MSVGDVVYEHVDEDGDHLAVREDRGGRVLVTSSGAYVAPRALRDALNDHLGEPADDDLAAAEAKGYSRGKADGIIAGVEHADRTASSGRLEARLLSAFADGKAQGYREGVEAGQLSERGAMSVGLPQRVTAVEVELFREAWEGAEPGNRIRSGLEAVETYRAWKAGRA